jgi:hypothetical protein
MRQFSLALSDLPPCRLAYTMMQINNDLARRGRPVHAWKVGRRRPGFFE